jgi:short-subunit dehydrogenase
MCYQLSKMGAKLILTARNEPKLEQVRSKLANPSDASNNIMYALRL